MRFVTLLFPFRDGSPARGAEGSHRRSSEVGLPEQGDDGGQPGRRRKPRTGIGEWLPGFSAGTWKRNLVVGLGYLLGGLSLLALLRYAIGFF